MITDNFYFELVVSRQTLINHLSVFSPFHWWNSCFTGAPPPPQKLQSQSSLRLWQCFLSTWESGREGGFRHQTNGHGSDVVGLCCYRKLCHVSGIQQIASWQFETCGSNLKRSCWKTPSSYGSPRRITSISCCKGDGGTEKVEAVWQVPLTAVFTSSRAWGSCCCFNAKHIS